MYGYMYIWWYVCMVVGVCMHGGMYVCMVVGVCMVVCMYSGMYL